MKNKTVTGEYSEDGYEVFVSGQWVYSTGNHALDSTICVPPRSGEAVSLRTLRRYCSGTCREIANEINANFGRLTRRSVRKQEDAQASGMNKTDSHEFALNQAADEAATNEHAQPAKPAIQIPVSDPHKEARTLLVEALCHEPKHDSACAGQNFANKNRFLPANHPAWKSAPACNCWVGRMAEWLKEN